MRNFEKISIVIPAYNEESNIESVVAETERIAQQTRVAYEIIVVDDGSTDATLQKARVAAARHECVEVLTKPNGGIGSALKFGFSKASGDILIYSHGDGQFDFSQSAELVRAIQEGCDVAFGFKKGLENYSMFRKLNSYGLRAVLFVLYGIPFWDVNFVHAYTREAYSQIVPDADGVFYHAEIIIRARWKKMKIRGIPVTVRERVHGMSHGTSWRSILRTIRDLLAFRLRHFFGSSPRD